MIKKSRTNEAQPDFDDMMSEVEEELESQQAEQDIIDRVPELKTLSENIDKATNTWVNATVELESSIQQYQRAETMLGGAVKTISDKVDTINQTIGKVVDEAPTKLKVAVHVNNDDMQKIHELFNKEHKWMLGLMQKHINEVNAMFVEERRKISDRYKEYDGCYLGHYAQWFFYFFFVLGFFIFAATVVMLVGRWANRF